RCMRQGAVGQKCPRCARQPASARALGKPADYARLAVIAPLTAVAGALLYALALSVISFGSVILAAVLGFGAGRVVRWAVRGQSQQPFPAIAVTTAVIIVAGGLFLAG